MNNPVRKQTRTAPGRTANPAPIQNQYSPIQGTAAKVVTSMNPENMQQNPQMVQTQVYVEPIVSVDAYQQQYDMSQQIVDQSQYYNQQYQEPVVPLANPEVMPQFSPTPVQGAIDPTNVMIQPIQVQNDSVPTVEQHLESRSKVRDEIVIAESTKEMEELKLKAKFIEESARNKAELLRKIAEEKEALIEHKKEVVAGKASVEGARAEAYFEDEKFELNESLAIMKKEAEAIDEAFQKNIDYLDKHAKGLSSDKNNLYEIRKNELDGIVREAKERRKKELEHLKASMNEERLKIDAEIARIREEIVIKKKQKQEEIERRKEILGYKIQELNSIQQDEDDVQSIILATSEAEEERLKLVIESQQAQAHLDFEKFITQEQIAILNENLSLEEELQLLQINNREELINLKKILKEKEELSFKKHADVQIDINEINKVVSDFSLQSNRELTGVVVKEFGHKIMKRFKTTLETEGLVPAGVLKKQKEVSHSIEQYRKITTEKQPISLNSVVKLAAFIKDVEITDYEINKEQTRIACALINGMAVQIGAGYIQKQRVAPKSKEIIYKYTDKPENFKASDLYLHDNAELWSIINDSIMVKLNAGAIIQISKGLIMLKQGEHIKVFSSYQFLIA